MKKVLITGGTSGIGLATLSKLVLFLIKLSLSTGILLIMRLYLLIVVMKLRL